AVCTRFGRHGDLAMLKPWAEEFFEYHNGELAKANTSEEQAIGETTRHRSKPGRKLLPHNKWAREQFDTGRTIDEILPEYARRARETPVAARELLRKVRNAWHDRPT